MRVKQIEDLPAEAQSGALRVVGAAPYPADTPPGHREPRKGPPKNDRGVRA